jgi:hypothetical protein
MTEKPKLSAEYLIRKLIVSEGPKFSQLHPWLWEQDRLKELVFALFTQLSDEANVDLRQLVDQLFDMNLIDLSGLSKLPITDDDAFLKNEYVIHLNDSLTEFGFSEDYSKKAIISISQLASGLEKHFDGKIQLILRKYGELLLDNISKNFVFTELDPKITRFIFVYWLQNVCNIPITLDHDVITEFAEENQITSKELLDTADQMGLNIAFLDDLIDSYLANKKS